jgi:transposase
VPKAQAARLFDVSLSSVKRYSRTARRGDPLEPKKSPGRPRKVNESARVLLQEDVKERPGATVSQRRRFLEHMTAKSLSHSTVRRLMKRLGFSQKTECGGAGTRRVLEVRLEGYGRRASRTRAADLRRRDGHEHLTISDLWMVQEGRKGPLLGGA